MMRGYQILMPKGDRLVILRGAEFDWLISEARKHSECVRRNVRVGHDMNLPGWLDDHIDTELIIS